jgi:hypothetical protein
VRCTGSWPVAGTASGTACTGASAGSAEAEPDAGSPGGPPRSAGSRCAAGVPGSGERWTTDLPAGGGGGDPAGRRRPNRVRQPPRGDGRGASTVVGADAWRATTVVSPPTTPPISDVTACSGARSAGRVTVRVVSVRVKPTGSTLAGGGPETVRIGGRVVQPGGSGAGAGGAAGPPAGFSPRPRHRRNNPRAISGYSSSRKRWAAAAKRSRSGCSRSRIWSSDQWNAKAMYATSSSRRSVAYVRIPPVHHLPRRP